MPGLNSGFYSIFPGSSILIIAARRPSDIPLFSAVNGGQVKKTLRLLSCTLLLHCGLAFAQQQSIPSTSSYEDHGDYSINLQDLSIGLNADFRHKSGLIPFSATSTTVTNKFTSAVSHSGLLYIGAPGPVSFPVHVNLVGATAGFVKTTSQCGDGTTTWVFQAWTINTNDGNTHAADPIAGSNQFVDLKGCVSSTMTVATTDGSGLTAVITSYPTQQVTIHRSDGSNVTSTTTWPASAALGGFYTMRDSNGNSMFESSNVPPVVYTDSLGLTALTYTYVSTTSSNVSWTDVNGNSQAVTLTYALLYPSTAFGCASPNKDWTGAAQLSYATNVAYPNGVSLRIGYEQTPGRTSSYTTGRIASLTLRTGGSASFSYSGFDCTYLEPTTMTRTTADGQWRYTWAHVTGGNTTTVVDPAGNTVVYTFNDQLLTRDGNLLPVLLGKTVNQGSSTVLYSESYCYNAASNCAAQMSFPITQTDVYTTLGTMSTSSHVRQTFDSPGNLLSELEYGFGSSTPTFVTTITYGTYNNGSCAAIGNYIVNKPCDVITKDAANNIVSETRNSYDAEGNKTSSSVWTGSLWLSFSATYGNGNGTVSTSTAVDGTQTTYTYGDCSRAFPTQVAVGGLNTYASWNCDGGVQTSSTDANGNITNYKYVNAAGTADPLWRLSQVIDPLGNVLYTIYGTNTVETKMIFGSSVQDSIVTVDGYGRVIRKQTKHGSSYDTVTTKYNVTASTSSTSVPCTVALGGDCTSGFTVATLDGAGRASSTVDGGGLTLTTTFPSQDTISTLSPHPTGENNKVVQSEIDGLGRTVSTCPILSTGGSACGQVAGGSGIATTFRYSTAAGSSTTTATRGVQTRTTVKDAIGRVISQTDPERGAVTYTYDYYAPTACSSPANLPGRLYVVTQQSNNDKCFDYDSIGRMTDMGENLANNSAFVCTRFRFDTSSNGIFTAPGTIFNGVGRMVEAETDDCTIYPPTAGHWFSDEWFSYDVTGNVTDFWEATAHSSGYYHSTATYFANKQLASLGIPGLGTVTYTIDGDGKLQTATLGRTLVNGVTYGPTGPTTIKIGSSTDKDVYGYSATTGKLASYQFSVGSSSNAGTVNWNTNGTLGSLVIADGFNSADNETCNFIYDDLSRVTSDQCGTPWAQTYSYDMYDNLKQFGSDPFTYTYNTANNQYSTSGVAYDADGDLTYDGVNNYTYNAQDKLWSVYPTGGSATSYVYDAFGHMVERESGGSYTQTLYGPNGQKLAGMSGQTLSYAFIPMPGGSQVLTSGASTFYYLHLDWLGSARTASTIPTSGTGTIFFDRQFAPYSQMYGNSGSAGTGSQMFTGDTHQSVGLFDTPNRELNQSQGRWLTPDPAHSGWNLYAYATDPNTSTDPTGLACYPLEKQMFGSCAGFMNNGANFGSSWNEFDILNWALTAYIGVIPDPDRTVNYPYGWIDYESGAFYSPGTYVFGWNYGNTFFPYAWLLDFDAGSYFNSYYNAKRSDARSLATSEDYIGALGSIARKAPDLCNPGISASAKIAGYGPEVTVDQSGVHGDFSVGLGKYAEVGTADPSITFSAGEGLGGSVTLNADRPGIPTVGAFAGVRTSNKLLEVDANVHADVVAMGSCPQ